MAPIVKTHKRILAGVKDKLAGIQANPRKVSLGYAFGVFLAATPFIGIKVPIALAVTRLFHWNKVSAIIGVFHVNLFTAPLFYGISFMAGRFVLGNRIDFTYPDHVTLRDMFELFAGNLTIFYNLLLGGLLLGLPMAAAAYCLSMSLLKRTLRPGVMACTRSLT